MSNIPADLKYAKSHEWVRVSGDTATIGITDHAQHELTDVVFVELPAVGQHNTSVAISVNIGVYQASIPGGKGDGGLRGGSRRE